MSGKVLIADDEEMIREAVRISLKGDGYEIFMAEDGIEALEKARKLKPQVLILDVMMPGVVGYRVCRELKDDPETAAIKVLFLTARGGKEAENTCRRSGADDFLPKPFEPRDLREKIKKLMKG